MSIVTVAELWFGAGKSERPGSKRRNIDAFLKPLEVLPFDHAAAKADAELRFILERAGRPIGERDLQITSIAVARRLTVATHNVSEIRPGPWPRGRGLGLKGKRPSGMRSAGPVRTT